MILIRAFYPNIVSLLGFLQANGHAAPDHGGNRRHSAGRRSR